MGTLCSTGFYLYRNCVYEVDLKNKLHIGGRLIDIKPDTLFFTNFFNENAASKAKVKLDTIAVYYKQLDKIRLVADRTMQWYVNHSFDNYDFIFKKDTTNCNISSNWEKIFSNDTALYEIAPHLTQQGITWLFEENGKSYYFYGGGMTKPDRTKMDTTYSKRNFFWFTPNKVEKINGLAFGVFPENVKNDAYDERDSLTINGLNIEVNPFAIFWLTNGGVSGPFPDSIEMYKEQIKDKYELRVNGINLSIVGTMSEARISGLNLAGLNTVVDNIQGITISGINNFCYELKGISIAGLRNRASIGRGIQIGLFNKTTDLRGIQIGLWNINGKRSLPFINWQFKAKKQ